MDLANHEQEQRRQTTQNINLAAAAGGGGGLVRYPSAPSSLLVTNLDSDDRLLSSRLMDDHLQFPEFEDKPCSLLSGAGSSMGRSNELLPPQYPRNSPTNTSTNRSSSALARQSSSPAGFFSRFNNMTTTSTTGYATTGVMGNVRMRGTGEVATSPTGLPTFPSRLQSSSLGLLSRISEVGDEGVDSNSPTYSQPKLPSNTLPPFFRSGYPVDSWDESAKFLENTGKMSPGIQSEQGSRPRILSHHLSLPKTSTELATMEKLMQFPDSVPCKIRAKRGCATHPRSIAERVRRTRISERMRKLQELVPNMDKQTNTSDMLDLAVDHIKDLQRQFKILSENHSNCKCASKLLIPQQQY